MRRVILLLAVMAATLVVASGVALAVTQICTNPIPLDGDQLLTFLIIV